MSLCRSALTSLLALPLVAQTYDFRLEVPYPKGQNLPMTMVGGTTQLATQGGLDTGKGYIFSATHRLVRVGPILRLDWGFEVARFNADGQLTQGTSTWQSKLDQMGFGIGLHAQFNVPFTGLTGEMGLIQRLQNYKFEAAGVKTDKNLSRTWLRVGGRFTLPVPLLNPYICASYQQPVSKDRPVQINGLKDIGAYLNAQGSGQEFDRLWTFGVGIAF